MIKNRKIILFIILLVAFILRFYKLFDYPAINADEAAIGYNAYSLIETGKDEHGNSWPIHFQSFNDYKPGLYVYLVLPFVKLFGLNSFSIRFPNAILSVITVYLVFHLTYHIFEKTKGKKKEKEAVNIGLISATLLAISPWHIHFSRGGWEVGTATFLITLGIYIFVRYKNSLKCLLFSALFFTLSLYTYHSARIIVPLIGILLLVTNKQEIFNNFKKYIVALLFFILISIPLIISFRTSEISSRASGVGIFADVGTITRINEQRGEHGSVNSKFGLILHNKAINYTLSFFENYLSHFSGDFLFIKGDDIQRNKVPETGALYLFDFVFLSFGLWFMFKDKKSINNRKIGLVFGWLLISPVAAALTFQSPHALRSQNMIIPLVIIMSYGFYKLLTNKILNTRYYFVIISTILLTTYSFLFSRYLHMYYFHLSKEYPFSSQYGLRKLGDFINKYDSNSLNKIVITDKYDQPYILLLYYLKYPPEKFQKDHQLTKRDEYGFSTVNGFDKFVFKEIDWDNDRVNYPNSLIIGSSDEIPSEANIIYEVVADNDYNYFKIVKN